MKKKKQILVPNWKRLGRSWTVIFAIVFALANVVMGGLFILTPFFDAQLMAIINFVCFVIVGVGRILRQSGLDLPPDPEKDPTQTP